jgi:hypothetical protein
MWMLFKNRDEFIFGGAQMEIFPKMFYLFKLVHNKNLQTFSKKEEIKSF